MRFEIPHAQLLHQNLAQIRAEFEEKGSLGVIVATEDGRRSLRFPTYGFNATYVDLPAPLNRVGLAVRARGGFYSVTIPTIATSGSYLEGLSEKFAREFEQRKEEGESQDDELEWIETNPRGVGHFTRDGRIIISVGSFSIDDNHLLDNGRAISLGDYGSDIKEVEADWVDFNKEITLLQKVATYFVRSVYDIHNLGKRFERDVALTLNWLF